MRIQSTHSRVSRGSWLSAATLLCLLADWKTLADDCRHPTFSLRGQAQFGAALVQLGDLDGDGVEDYATSALGRPDDSDSVGVVHVISGRTSTLIFSIGEMGSGGNFGYALASLPVRKLPGDEQTSAFLLVGAPCTNNNRGRAVAYKLTVEGASKLFHLDGEATGELLGAAVAVVPVGNDPRFALGVPGSNPGGQRRGRVLLIDSTGTFLSQSIGEVDFEGYGRTLVGTGDVNGDGAADLLIGSQDPRPGGDTAGWVTIRSADGTLLVRLKGQPGEHLGGTIALSEDLDGDGLEDFLVSAVGPGRPYPCQSSGDPPAPPPGKVYVLRGGVEPVAAGGTLGARLRVLSDAEPGALFGAGLAQVADIDLDGVPELAISAPFSSAPAKGRTGRIDIFRGSDGGRLWSWYGSVADDRLGMTLLALGDQTADGVGDLLASQRRDEGEVSLFALGDRNQNGERDACEGCAVPEPLAVGQTVELSLTRTARARCFRFAPQPGVTLRLSLEARAPSNSAVLSFRWGDPPERGLQDQALGGAQAAFPGIVLSGAPAQAGFVLVEAQRLPTAEGSFSLTLEAVTAPLLHSMTPARSGQAADLHLAVSILGLALPPDIGFRLQPIAGGASFQATEVERLSERRIDARFRLNSAPQGVYDLVAWVGGAPITTLPGAFVITPPSGPQVPRVTVRGPRIYRNNTLSRLTLRFENLGSQVLPPPLFRVVGPPGTTLGFARQRQIFRDSILGLGRAPSTADGAIPPGGKVDVPIWFRRQFTPEECPPESTECPFDFDILLLNPQTHEPIDWSHTPAPQGISEAEWQQAIPKLAQGSSTWTEYYQQLVEFAALGTRRGFASPAALPPFGHAILQALGYPPAAITGWVRGQERGEAVPGVLVVALLGTEPMAFASTNREGYFALKWLENDTKYRLEIVEPSTNAVVSSLSPSVLMPGSGDLYGVEILVTGGATEAVIQPACPPCEAAPLPREALVPPPSTLGKRGSLKTQLISAFDPNDKNGSGSQGGDAEIDPLEAIEYRIDFENTQQDTGAAARYVEIVDRLDPELDWTTVELLDVAIEARPEPIFVSLGEGNGTGLEDFPGASSPVVDPSNYEASGSRPVAVARWSGTIEYRHGQPDSVEVDLRIVGSVEPAGDAFLGEEEQGVIRWTISTAGNWPWKPREGFLAFDCPAADENGEISAESTPCGGHVSFSVLPASTVADGTRVTNDAEIIFDANAPELTEPPAEVTIVTQPPGVPNSPAPASVLPSRVVLANEAQLFWEAEYAETFDLYLWPASEGDTRPAAVDRLLVRELGTPLAIYPADGSNLILAAGTSYRWQVIARNGRGASTPGPVWSFATMAFFRRGDADANGRLEITDAIRSLNYLFVDGATPSCLDALDADDSGVIGITDPIVTLQYLFLGGTQIPFPGPETCGSDPSADPGGADMDLGCSAYGECR